MSVQSKAELERSRQLLVWEGLRANMKVIRRISYFLVIPLGAVGIGFLCGILFMDYFYPGKQPGNQPEIVQEPSGIIDYQTLENQEKDDGWNGAAGKKAGGTDGIGNASGNGAEGMTAGTQKEASELERAGRNSEMLSEELLDALEQERLKMVSSADEKLTADTDYVLEETDIRNQTVVETVWNLPAMYIGMNREQFLEAMEMYETAPPLTELERGFVSLEVLSFSAERVVVQMNYEYTQPSKSFYIKVENNFLVVYLDDQKTIYMYTNIRLDELPEQIQRDIINVMFVPDEERLYDFLESYSS